MYSAFLPHDRRIALRDGTSVPDRVVGAALFVDLSGFTQLTAALAAELGPRRGAEELVRHLDRIFSTLINEVQAYGGDVVLFNGDAITCWFAEQSRGDSAAARATSCALAIQAATQQHGAIVTPNGNSIEVAVQAGIAAGPARRFLLGNPDAYVIEALAGSTLDRMAAAEELAQRGEVVVSAEVVEQLPGEPVILDWREVDGQRFARVAPWPGQSPRSDTLPLPDVDHDVARCWLMPPVAARISQGSETFLADLRPTVSLFTGFSGIDYDGDDEAGDKLNRFIVAAQAILDRYEGFLVQATMGDKGSLLYISFGAPVAHEDDSERAAAAALALRELTDSFPFLEKPCIGISRGMVYSGAYGSAERRTYSLLGTEVNIAARLMTAADPGMILVSGYIAEDVDKQFVVEALPPIRVKGIDHNFAVWNLTDRRVSSPQLFKTAERIQVFGRRKEQSIIKSCLSRLQEGKSGSLFIEGSAGVGKSVLLNDLLLRAETMEPAVAHIMVGGGDAIEQSTPYLAWQPILRQVFDKAIDSTGMSLQERSDALVNWLEPDVRYLAPLLNSLISVNVPENQFTSQMTGEARLLSTQELLVSLLTKALDGQPAILVLDDAQWLDSLSAALLRRVGRDIAPLLLVLALRPGPVATQTMVAELRDAPEAEVITLDTLTIAATERLITQQMEAAAVDRELLSFIYEKAEGHPFFTVELVRALRDNDLVGLNEAGIGVFIQGSDTVVDFPDTIQGVITSRIDRLNPSEQLLVKVASVIGRIFGYRLLRDVYPSPQDADQIRANLEDLERLEITALEAVEPDLTYLFRHIITQEVVYDLMTTAQRAQLHESIALWYERIASGAQDGRYDPLLAHHWFRAGDQQKAAVYYGKAGENAVREYANEEAIEFLSAAIRLGTSLPVVQRAHWQRMMGEAAYRLTRVEESKKYYGQALALLGHPVPTSKGGVAVGLASAALRQVANRQLPPRKEPSDPQALAALRESALALDRVSEVYYNTGDELSSFYAVLSALNLAEQAGPSPELVRGFANMCGTLGTVSLTRLADSYRDRALAMAADLDHLPTSAWIQINFSIYSLWQGDWHRALSEIAEGMDLHAQLGDWRLWCVAAWMLPQVSAGQGHLQLAGRQWAQVYDTALLREDTRHQVRARGGQFFNTLATGDLQEAARCLTDVDDVLRQHPEMVPIEERLWYGMQARFALESVQPKKARELTTQQVAAIKRTQFKFDLLDVFAGPVEVRLRLWESGQSTPAEAREAGKLLGRYARTYPFARARALRNDGTYHWLDGKHPKAMQLWQKSISQADLLGMPLEKALTMETMAHYTGDDTLLSQATTIRAELKAVDPDMPT